MTQSEKKETVKRDAEMAWMLELEHKDFKLAIIRVF